MRALVPIVAASTLTLALASCGSDSSPSPSGATSSSGDGGTSSTSSSGGNTSTSGGGSSSGGTTSSSGGTSGMCSARYCCNFDGLPDECKVDNADVEAYGYDSLHVVQTQSVSPPSSAKLNSFIVLPKQTAGKRVEIQFALRVEKTATDRIALFQGGGGELAVILESGALWISDSGKISAGALTQGAWNHVTVVIDIAAKTYGVSVNGGAAATRDMTAPNGFVWSDVDQITLGANVVSGETIAYFDDVRVDWN